MENNNPPLPALLERTLAEYLERYNQGRSNAQRPPIPNPILVLFARGARAGYCRWHEIGEIGINATLAAHDLPHALHDTLPHELAHWIVHCRWCEGEYGRRPRPHGPEWRWECIALTGRKLTRTHKLDTSLSKARRTRWRKLIGEQSGRVYWVRYRRHDRGDYQDRRTGERLRKTQETVLAFQRPHEH